MKKFLRILPVLSFLFMVSVIRVSAQTDTARTIPATPDFFTGKWKSMILGIPQGDTEVTIVFEKKDGKLTGSMLDAKTNVTSVFEEIKFTDSTLTTNFTAQGYHVSLALKPGSAQSFTGTMMDQFDVTGVRIK